MHWSRELEKISGVYGWKSSRQISPKRRCCRRVDAGVLLTTPPPFMKDQRAAADDDCMVASGRCHFHDTCWITVYWFISNAVNNLMISVDTLEVYYDVQQYVDLLPQWLFFTSWKLILTSCRPKYSIIVAHHLHKKISTISFSSTTMGIKGIITNDILFDKFMLCVWFR